MKTIGAASSIPFDTVPNLEGYCPNVQRDALFSPLLCVDITNISRHFLPLRKGIATDGEAIDPLDFCLYDESEFPTHKGESSSSGLAFFGKMKCYNSAAPRSMGGGQKTLPDGWVVKHSPDGRKYHMDMTTKTSHHGVSPEVIHRLHVKQEEEEMEQEKQEEFEQKWEGREKEEDEEQENVVPVPTLVLPTPRVDLHTDSPTVTSPKPRLEKMKPFRKVATPEEDSVPDTVAPAATPSLIDPHLINTHTDEDSPSTASPKPRLGRMKPSRTITAMLEDDSLQNTTILPSEHNERRRAHTYTHNHSDTHAHHSHTHTLLHPHPHPRGHVAKPRLVKKKNNKHLGARMPQSAQTLAQSQSGRLLPPGWDVRWTPSGKPYYTDNLTKTTQWNRPE